MNCQHLCNFDCPVQWLSSKQIMMIIIIKKRIVQASLFITILSWCHSLKFKIMLLDSPNSTEQLLGFPDGYLQYAELLLISSTVWWIMSAIWCTLWEFLAQVNVSYSRERGRSWCESPWCLEKSWASNSIGIGA